MLTYNAITYLFRDFVVVVGAILFVVVVVYFCRCSFICCFETEEEEILPCHVVRDSVKRLKIDGRATRTGNEICALGLECSSGVCVCLNGKQYSEI